MGLPYKCPRCQSMWLDNVNLSGFGCIICLKAEERKVVADAPLSPEYAAEMILREFERARMKHAPMRGAHEGYAVILEELDEAWTEIKANNIEKARKEMLQVAAMALAFLVEVK